jgi:hypothetical protein
VKYWFQNQVLLRRTVKTMVLSCEEDTEKLFPKIDSCEVDSKKLIPKPDSFEEDSENTGSKTMFL